MNSTNIQILSPDQLARSLNQQDLLLLDVRTQYEYQQGHIPSAQHFDIKYANKNNPPTAGLLPEPEEFAQYVASVGGHSKQDIVIYDSDGGPPAGRLIWTLAAYGKFNTAMLDGGLYAWLTHKLPLETKMETASQGQFIPSYTPDCIADKNEILSKLGQTETVILDARSVEEFNGKQIRSARGGHIPGAVNLDWRELKDPTNGQFKPTPILQEILTQKGITTDKEIIVYCQTHQRSALFWVLLKSLGYPRVKGYPGSWSDWGNDVSTPIEI